MHVKQDVEHTRHPHEEKSYAALEPRLVTNMAQ